MIVPSFFAFLVVFEIVWANCDFIQFIRHLGPTNSICIGVLIF